MLGYQARQGFLRKLDAAIQSGKDEDGYIAQARQLLDVSDLLHKNGEQVKKHPEDEIEQIIWPAGPLQGRKGLICKACGKIGRTRSQLFGNQCSKICGNNLQVGRGTRWSRFIQPMIADAQRGLPSKKAAVNKVLKMMRAFGPDGKPISCSVDLRLAAQVSRKYRTRPKAGNRP